MLIFTLTYNLTLEEMASPALFHQLLAENKNHQREPPAFLVCPLLRQVKLFTSVTEATLSLMAPQPCSQRLERQVRAKVVM